jgi:hypothetical protein
MILEHAKDPVSARWDNDKNSWDVGEKTKYRWVTHDNVPVAVSDWFYEIREALNWIIDYDKKRGSV